MRLDQKLLRKVKSTVFRSARNHKLNVLSIVLYGSRAKGNFRAKSDYDIFVLLGDRTDLRRFIQFSAEARIMSSKIGLVKLFACTRKDFEAMLSGNPFLGAFCYIIATEGKPIYDKGSAFKSIQKTVAAYPAEKRRKLLKACLEMSRKLGSKHWSKHWLKKLGEI